MCIYYYIVGSRTAVLESKIFWYCARVGCTMMSYNNIKTFDTYTLCTCNRNADNVRVPDIHTLALWQKKKRNWKINNIIVIILEKYYQKVFFFFILHDYYKYWFCKRTYFMLLYFISILKQKKKTFRIPNILLLFRVLIIVAAY